MPAKSLKLFAVLTIPKETQFSKKNRVEEGTFGPRSYTTTLVPARTMEEVEEIASHWVSPDANYRIVIYELAEPVAMKRLSISSVAERPNVVLNRAGSFA